MSKHIVYLRVRFIVALTLLAFASITAEAAPIKSTKLKASEVKASVDKALKAIPGSALRLRRIEGIHQGTGRNLKPKQELIGNTATIYAVVSGNINVGQPLVFNSDIELVFCNQLNDKRWICRFSIVDAALRSLVPSYFFLEK